MGELSELKREGRGIQAISELMDFDPKTVRKYELEPEAVSEYAPRVGAPRKLDECNSFLTER